MLDRRLCCTLLIMLSSVSAAVGTIDKGKDCAGSDVRDLTTTCSGEFSISYVTTPSHEVAEKLATSLVEARLAACINIIPKVTSIYRWQGKINKDSEALMMIKSPTKSVRDLTEFVKANHPYEVCEVISLPIETGNKEYLQFLHDATVGNKH
ncbi:uncharacterized protein LOC100904369 [Galendromus occidentalis]|uniref:Uncharacterized protein LOC100904369 n=1 Tax=Galendromus occidentalis TaxID=34638 RepID=A0AAJ6QS03_9ACAR|nr:uncharacterized protein LOC100904369 [Galendromus occidentalis]